MPEPSPSRGLYITRRTVQILCLLADATGPLTRRDIVKMTGMDAGVASKNLTRLIQRGWVRATRPPERGAARSLVYVFTEAGRAQADAVLKDRVPRETNGEP